MRHQILLLLAATITTMTPVLSAEDSAAQQAAAAGKYQQADRLYKELIAKSGQNADYHIEYARFLRKTGQTASAMDEYQKALQIKPGQNEASTALADISLQMLDLENAIKYAESVLSANPHDRAAGMIYASACLQSGRTAQADKALSALMSPEKDFDVLHLAYQIKARKGDFQQARVYLQEAVAGRPDQVSWTLELCKLLETSGDYQTSRRYLQTALDRDPSSTEARIALARNLEVFENDYPAAIAQYEEVLKSDPESPKALAGIDRCSAKKNDLALRLKLGLQSMFQHH